MTLFVLVVGSRRKCPSDPARIAPFTAKSAFKRCKTINNKPLATTAKGLFPIILSRTD